MPGGIPRRDPERASEVLAWLWYVLPPAQYIIKPFCGGTTVLVGPETELPRNTLRKKLCAWSASVRLNATQSTSGGFRHYLLCGFMWFDATEICFGKTEIYFLHPSAASFACTTTDRTDRDVREGSLALLLCLRMALACLCRPPRFVSHSTFVSPLHCLAALVTVYSIHHLCSVTGPNPGLMFSGTLFPFG